MNILQKMRGETTTVGLDIGNHSLKLVKLRHARNGIFLEATGIKELPVGTIEGSEIKNRTALIDSLTTLINQCDPRIVEVVINMTGHGIITDKFTFKIDPNENAEELILWEAGQRSPFDVDDITLDYKILHRNSQTSEVEVMIVAAKNQIMQNYIDLLYEAGLKPIIVDTDAFAITNCYSFESGENAARESVALINLGHNQTTLAFVKDGVYHSMRSISTAGEFFSKTLQRNLGVSPDVAAAILKGRNDPTLDEQMVVQAIEYAAEELSAAVDLVFSFFKSSEKRDSIDKIILSGGGAYFPGIVPFLEKRHETSVMVSNPLNVLQYDHDLFGGAQRIAALLSVATGLALRKVVSV